MPRVTEQLTTESLARFKGGEAEIQNQSEGYLYRGEIADIKVEEKSLVIKFAWSAKMGDNDEWENNSELDYAASLKIYAPSDIGDGRMHFGCWIRLVTK